MCKNMDESQRYYVAWKNPDTEEYLLYESMNVKFNRKTNAWCWKSE